jgi:hypothetical protein
MPMASLWEIRLSMIVHDTPMLLSAPPFEQTLPEPSAPPKTLLTT